jgi:hypothetical protein
LPAGNRRYAPCTPASLFHKAVLMIAVGTLFNPLVSLGFVGLASVSNGHGQDPSKKVAHIPALDRKSSSQSLTVPIQGHLAQQIGTVF